MDFSTSTKSHIITSQKTLTKDFPWFDASTSVLYLYTYIDNYWSQVVKRSRSWTTSLYTYLGPVSHLIWFTPCQTLGWPWSHTYIFQPLKMHLKIFTCQNLLHNHFVFICRYLIIFLKDLSSVSPNCSRAGF